MTNTQCQAGKQRPFACHPYRLTLPQLLLGAVEVEVDVETLHKLCDRILVCVRLLQEGNKKHYSGTEWIFGGRMNKNFLLILMDHTCWMTFTKSLSTCLRFRTSLLVMTAVVRYRKMCGHIVWMAFRYLRKKKTQKAAHSGIIISCHYNRSGSH